MAQKRMLSTSLYASEKIMDCSSDTIRLLFVWICLSVDDDAKMQAKPRTIKAKFFGYREDITIKDCEVMLQELSTLGLIIYFKERDTDNSFIEIPKWLDINSIRKDLYKKSEILSYSSDLHDVVQFSNVSVTNSLPSVVKVSLVKDSIVKNSIDDKIIKKDDTIIEPKTTKDIVSVKPKKPKKEKEPKIQYADNVLMTVGEYNQIITKYFNGDKKLMDLAIDKLDSAKLAHDYKYKSDAGAMRTWVVKDIKKTMGGKVSSVTPGNFDSAEPIFAKLLEEQRIEEEREQNDK